MSTTELKTIGTGTDAMIAQATEAMESFRPMVAKVREHESLTVELNGIGEVSDARKRLKRLRVDIDKKRSELNKGALEFQRTVNSIAKELTKPVEEVEEILQAREDAHEAKKEAERRAKFEAEEAARIAIETERQEKKQARVNQMIEAGVAVDWVAADLPEGDWEHWLDVSARSAAATRQRIEEKARIARDFEERQRKEREELAAKMAEESKRQAEELRIRADELERQRLADEAVLAEQREAMEAEREALRQQQEEVSRLDAIRRKRIQDEEEAENLRKWNEEQAVIAAEKLARVEAMQPEIDKAKSFAECMVTDAQDSLIRLGNPSWGSDAMHLIRNCGSSIVALVIR